MHLVCSNMLSHLAKLNSTKHAILLLTRGTQTNTPRVNRLDVIMYHHNCTIYKISRVCKSSSTISEELTIGKEPEANLPRRSTNAPYQIYEDFYRYSISVLEKKLKLEDILNSEKFKQLQEDVKCNASGFNNSTLIYLLASAIRMRLDSNELVKNLESEAEHRLERLTISQLIRLLNSFIHYSASMTPDRVRLTSLLTEKISEYFNSGMVSLQDYKRMLCLLANEAAPKSLLPLVEESLLAKLTTADSKDFAYYSLCEIFIQLAANSRRPVPILTALTIKLCNIHLNEQSSNGTMTIIKTLEALSFKLNYPNEMLIAKLTHDLKKVIVMEKTDSHALCMLLGSLGKLRWRSDELMQMFLRHLRDTMNSGLVNHHVAVTFLSVAASLNYMPDELGQIFNSTFLDKINENIDRKSLKWLNHVWSLVALKLDGKSYLTSVLDRNFYSIFSNLNYHKARQLLNLRAIALNEHKFTPLDPKEFDIEMKCDIQRSISGKKFASTVQEMVELIIGPPDLMRTNVQTDYGFTIDCEVCLDENLRAMPLTDFKSSDKYPGFRKCALIFVQYEDMIVNTNDEVVGHIKMISRILEPLGYHTIFISETMMNSTKTSSDLTKAVRLKIKSSFREELKVQ